MTIQLKRGQEMAIQAAIKAGTFRSVDDFMESAIAMLANSPLAETSSAMPRKSRLWELREGLNLGDLSIKELIEEGRE